MMMFKNQILSRLFSLFFVLISFTASAQDKQQSQNQVPIAGINPRLPSQPLFEGKISASLSAEETFAGKGKSDEYPTNSSSNASFQGNLYFTEDLYLSGNFGLSGSRGNKTTSNYFIDESYGSIRELALRYDSDNYALVAGRTNVNFSLAKRYAAGMGGSAVPSEYGVDGMIVLGGQYSLNAGSLGNHAISFNAFKIDNSILADSFGINKDQIPLEFGGAGNTGKFNNFAIALDGLKIQSLPSFRYQLAAARLITDHLYNTSTKKNVDPKYLADESRFVAAVMWDKLDFLGDVKVTPLLEYNRTINSLGIGGYNKSFYTGSLLFTYKQWNLGVSGSVWDTNWSEIQNGKNLLPANANTADRHNQLQVALGYAFENGIRASIGYRKEYKYSNVHAQTIGITLSYNYSFAFMKN